MNTVYGGFGQPDEGGSHNPPYGNTEIGSTPAGSARFIGQMQDVRVYDHVLTSEEVIAIYNDTL